MSALATIVMAQIGEATNRTLVLPIVMFAPTHRCNSACVSCAWWSTPAGADAHGPAELTLGEIDRIAADLARLGTRLVVFTGGEPLMRPDVFDAARAFQRRGIRLHLLTAGLGLHPRVASVAELFERVIVSLDGDTRERYADIRGVDGFDAVAAGVDRLRRFAPTLPISARSTIHQRNFQHMPHLVETARAMGMRGISFLAADLRSAAFGHRDIEALQSLRLGPDDVRECRQVIEQLIETHARDFASGFIAESPDKLRQIAQYYAAINGDDRFPAKACNAPWMSAVIEANGDLRPCFFHPVVGSVRRDGVLTVVRKALPQFRASLDVTTNAICERCVCSLKVGWLDQPWA